MDEKSKKEEPQDELLHSVVETIMGIEQAKDLSIEDIHVLADKAIDQDQMKNLAWLEEKVEELASNVTKKDQDQDHSAFLASIKVSDPKEIKNENDLQDILRNHRAWMDSVRSPGNIKYGTRANLSGANLSGYNLTKAELSCANLDGANLVGANLSHANFAKCSLLGANLQGTILKHTNFKGALMGGCDLRDADIENCNFDKVDMEKVELDSKYLNLRCSGKQD